MSKPFGKRALSHRRRCFTLVEVLVGGTCGILVAVALIGLFRGGIRMFRSEEGRTSSLQNLLLVYDRIQTDLREVVYYPQLDIRDKVEITQVGGKDSLILTRHAPYLPEAFCPSGVPDVPRSKIQYSLKPVQRGNRSFYYLKREADGEEFLYSSMAVKDLTFKRVEMNVTEAGKDRPFIGLIMYVTTTTRSNKAFDELVFPFLFTLESETHERRDPSWVSGF